MQNKANPVESPKSSATVDPPKVLQERQWLTWSVRFFLGAIVLISLVCLNAASLWMTWRGDGTEQVGFPFTFYEHGGFSYHQEWHYEMLAIDIAIAFAGAFFTAYLLRHGLIASICDIQRCGLGHIYEDDNTSQRIR